MRRVILRKIPRPARCPRLATGLFALAVDKMKALGGIVVEIDLTPFTEAAKLLCEGPWVAERWAAVGEFVDLHPAEETWNQVIPRHGKPARQSCRTGS